MKISEALDGYLPKLKAEREKQEQQRAGFLERFPRSVWPDLPLDRYALNTPDYRNSYSYLLEWGTPDLGSISGGSAKKHVIFRRNSGEWSFPPGFASVDTAWEALRSAFMTMFDLADLGDWTSTSEIDMLRGARVVRLKSLHLYFPDDVLPVYSHSHLTHFAGLFGLDTSGDAIDVNRRLLHHLVALPELNGQDSSTLARVLYAWSPPPGARVTKYWKVAPGARGRFWDECREGNYICVGWDEIGDLSLFDTEDDFKTAFTAAYADEYNGNKSAITQKAKELWRLREMSEGDKIIANRGTREILAVGKVTAAGYQYRSERREYHHTVNVEWNLGAGRVLDEPVKRWATTTVAKIPATHVERLLNPNVVITEPDEDPTTTAEDEPRYTKWKKILDRKGQLIFYGPPGTGKTRAAKGFASWLLRQHSPNATTESHLTEVTFHASYAYEDFIEGFRPKAGETELKLELRDGIFKRVASEAASHPDELRIVIIDEINRADVPRVFGELMTVLEIGRRGQSVTLPTSGERLTVPENVVVLGTMNTADQSIRSLDAALRRRFGFIELMPDSDLLADTAIDELPLDQFLTELNQRIAREAGRERQIGHSFFLDNGAPIEAAETFGEVIRSDIIPLLQEIAYDDYSQLKKFLGSAVIDEAGSRLTPVVLDDGQLVAALADEYNLQIQSIPE
ncbi:AAA family ATPase [Mycolicibacterium rufum]|uniref:AAA family ATPase n=1 Tax=Mycolicibacterium rufum TaxID=318424 RepID=A0ABY3UKM8_9MYCO|nr:AAA family ATPase [Mycolicibacterium rufum]ULP37680.1 AAA family ATPase [Mycolicibacterium rufum]